MTREWTDLNITESIQSASDRQGVPNGFFGFDSALVHYY